MEKMNSAKNQTTSLCCCGNSEYEPSCWWIALRVLSICLVIAGVAVFALGISQFIQSHFTCLLITGVVLFFTGVLYFCVSDCLRAHNIGWTKGTFQNEVDIEVAVEELKVWTALVRNAKSKHACQPKTLIMEAAGTIKHYIPFWYKLF